MFSKKIEEEKTRGNEKGVGVGVGVRVRVRVREGKGDLAVDEERPRKSSFQGATSVFLSLERR